MDGLRDYFITLFMSVVVLSLIAMSVYQVLISGCDLCPTDIREQILYSNVTVNLSLEEWLSLLPPGTKISDGSAPWQFYLTAVAFAVLFVYAMTAVKDSVVITITAVYYHVIEDEVPQARDGRTIVHSYISCYEEMSDAAKDVFGLLLLDGWLFGTISRIVHFILSAAWLVFWNFPSNGTKIHGYWLMHSVMTVVFYVLQTLVVVSFFAPQIRAVQETNVFSYPEMRNIFMQLHYNHNMLAMKILLFDSAIYAFLSTLIRKRVNKLVFDHKPTTKLVERDSNNLKKVFGFIVDQAYKMKASKTDGYTAEAAMPQSDFHTATCPKWQIFFTADEMVIGSGFVCKRGIITVLHVYQVLSCEARAGKEIRIVGPKGSAKFPKHQLQISVEVSETIALKVDPSLYSIIGAKSISLKSIKPSTPGPVSIYGHKDGVVKRTMGAITGQSDSSVLNFEHNSSTLAGWSGSPLFSGDNIVGIHRGSDGIHNICENVYVGLGCHRAAIKEVREIYRKAKDTATRVVVLESFNDVLTTPTLSESGKQLAEEAKIELRAARQEEVEEKYQNVKDEAERKSRIRRDMIEYDDDLADLDSGTLMSIYADLVAFGTLTEDQEEYLGVRAKTLAKPKKSGKAASKIADEAEAPTADVDTPTVVVGVQTRVSPAQTLVPKVITLESDAEPVSDFQPGPGGSTVKTPSSSSSGSASQPAQATSTTRTSERSSQSSRRSQQRSPTPLTSPTAVITQPAVILSSAQAHLQFPTLATVTELTRKQRRVLNSSLKDLEVKMQEVQSLLAKGTNQGNRSQSESSQPPPTNQPSVGTSTPQPVQQPSAGA